MFGVRLAQDIVIWSLQPIINVTSTAPTAVAKGPGMGRSIE